MGTNPKTDPNFGNGEVGGDRTWGSPIHATTPGGNKVTVAYGEGGHPGEVLVCSGHVDGKLSTANKATTTTDQMDTSSPTVVSMMAQSYPRYLRVKSQDTQNS